MKNRKRVARRSNILNLNQSSNMNSWPEWLKMAARDYVEMTYRERNGLPLYELPEKEAYSSYHPQNVGRQKRKR